MRTLLAVIVALVATACDSGKRPPVTAPAEHTPLPHDPMDEYEIARWWSSGGQLLRLDAIGSYVLYPGTNRYHDPVARGSWSQQSFAELRLMPYDAHRTEWIRVGVTREDGAIVLRIKGHEPMYALPSAPLVPEDRLLGAWAGASGTLVLDTDGRYGFVPEFPGGDPPAIAVGHDGRWRLEDAELELRPDPPNLGPFVLLVEKDERVPRRLVGENAVFGR